MYTDDGSFLHHSGHCRKTSVVSVSKQKNITTWHVTKSKLYSTLISYTVSENKQEKLSHLSHTLSSVFSFCRASSWSADVKAGVFLSRSFSARVFSTIFLSTATAFSSCSGVRPLSPICHSNSINERQSSRWISRH